MHKCDNVVLHVQYTSALARETVIIRISIYDKLKGTKSMHNYTTHTQTSSCANTECGGGSSTAQCWSTLTYTHLGLVAGLKCSIEACYARGVVTQPLHCLHEQCHVCSLHVLGQFLQDVHASCSQVSYGGLTGVSRISSTDAVTGLRGASASSAAPVLVRRQNGIQSRRKKVLVVQKNRLHFNCTAEHSY